MRPFILFLFLTGLSLVSCHRSIFDSHTARKASGESYNEVGNGGDFIRILMEEGRLYAAGIVGRLRADAFPSNIRDYLREGELDWLWNHRREIEKDIRESRFIWVDRLPSGCPDEECGCAFRSEKKIYFAQGQCESSLRKRQDAAKLVIHESMHHFVGDDEAKAKRLGVALYTAWYNMGHPDSPHWKIFKPTTHFWAHRSHGLWNGRELMIWTRTSAIVSESHLAFYNPSTDSWRYETAAAFPAPEDAGAAKSLLPVWTGGTAFLLTGPSLDVKRYDRSSRKWSSIARPPLAGFWASTAVGCGGNLVVLNADSDWDAKRLLPNAAVLDLSGTWRAMPREGGPLTRLYSSAICAGERLMVWGGHSSSAREHTWDTASTGMLYDFTRRAWSSVSREGGPGPRTYPQLLWTGKEVLVYGGFGSTALDHNAFQVSGGAYDPKLNQWRAIQNGPAPRSPRDFWGYQARAIWTGTEALFFNDLRIDSYDPFHDRWTTNDSSNYPDALTSESPAWTGMEMIVWDGNTHTGYLYYP